MSIINEALKKAQKDKASRETKGAISTAKEERPAEAPSKIKPPANFYLIALFGLAALSAALYYAKGGLLKPKPMQKQVIELERPIKPAEPRIAPLRTLQDETSPSAEQNEPITGPSEQPGELQQMTPPQQAPPAAAIPDEELPRLTLNGVILGKGEPLAMIENVILKKGEYIDGAQVIDIGNDSVELDYKGRRYKIRTR